MSQYGFFCRHLKMGRPSCFSPSSNASHKPAVIFVIMIITSIQQWHDYLVFTPCSITALPTMQANVNVQRAPCQTLAHFSKCAFLRQNDKEACRCLAQFKKKDAYFFCTFRGKSSKRQVPLRTAHQHNVDRFSSILFFEHLSFITYWRITSIPSINMYKRGKHGVVF